MAISLNRARDFVYSNGTRWERALFAHLFQDGLLERVHKCLLTYKNADGGWAHGLEHDITSPDSHPLALEYLLTIMRDTGIAPGSLLNGSVAWLEANRNPDGSLKNPDSVLDYPHAAWWDGGGQTIPASTTGNLMMLGLCSDALAASTRPWAEANLAEEHIQSNEWLFMAYHAHDYYLNVEDFPDLEKLKTATLKSIVKLAEAAPEKQYYVLFQFAPTPESAARKSVPDKLVKRNLDYLAETQRDDGGWADEHDLPQRQSYVTMVCLLALQRHGRLQLA